MDRKALSLPLLTSLVVGNMIGTGIYLLPASLAQYGMLSLFSWIYTSIGALFLAVTFTHLTKRYPKTGGPYAYAKEAFGKPLGFIVAYTYWMSYVVSVAGIAVASVGYLGFLSPKFDANSAAYSPYLVLMFEITVVWLFTMVNIIGVHTAGVVQLILTIIKILPLILIALLGFSYIQIDNLTQTATTDQSTFSAISSAAALTFWAFVGLESATVPAENTQGYSDIYKATVYGTLITALIYILTSFVLMGMIPVSKLQHSQFPFAEAGTILFGHNSALIIAICAVISGLGAMNACILLQGQIIFAAARDHLFPRKFAKLSKHDVPIRAQILSSSIVTAFLLFTIQPTLLKQFNNIAMLAALLTLAIYFTSTLAELKFVLQGKLSIPHVLLGKSFLVALLAGAYCVWMISSFEVSINLAGLGIVILCLPIYYFTVRKYVH